MNVYFSQEYARHRQAELVREADRARLAKVARNAADDRATTITGRRRVVLALGAAVAGILAIATAVLGRAGRGAVAPHRPG